jgi:hydrogenase maturation factor HypF (carbamoyltransferase family)
MTTEQVCTDCGALFDTADALEQHRGQGTHAQVFKCDECAEEFSSQAGLESHLAEVHAAEPDAPIR